MDTKSVMDPKSALQFMMELEKLLTLKGVWYKVEKENCPDLKFIRLECSIKVK
jgi:hypothetical protein